MRLQKLVNQLGLQTKLGGLALLIPLSFITASSTPAPAACQPLRGGLAGTKSHVVSRLVEYPGGCVAPLRNGDANFGYQHLLKRDREVGSHGWDQADKYYTQLAMNRQPFLVNTGYYAYSYPRTSKTTQCVFVDLKSFEGYPYKGLITSFYRKGANLTPRQCAGR